MIQLQMSGFIGNNLFQYAFARILAEDFGYALEIKQSNFKPGTNAPQFIELMSRFRDAPLSIPGKSFDHPVDKTAVIGHEGFDGFRIDFDRIRNCRQDRKILIEGHFERYEYFRDHKDKIRSWFEVEPNKLGYDISKDDIVLHIRRGDFIIVGRATSLSFYTNLLDKLDYRNVYICGVGLDDEVKQCFRRYNPIYVHGNPNDDFCFIKGFNRIIQSDSTFAWWAGFLSQAEEIYTPITFPDPGSFDNMQTDVDRRIDDESRYHYVYNVPLLERHFSLKDVISARHQLSKKGGIRSLMQLLTNRFRGNK